MVRPEIIMESASNDERLAHLSQENRLTELQFEKILKLIIAFVEKQLSAKGSIEGTQYIANLKNSLEYSSVNSMLSLSREAQGLLASLFPIFPLAENGYEFKGNKQDKCKVISTQMLLVLETISEILEFSKRGVIAQRELTTTTAVAALATIEEETTQEKEIQAKANLELISQVRALWAEWEGLVTSLKQGFAVRIAINSTLARWLNENIVNSEYKGKLTIKQVNEELEIGIKAQNFQDRNQFLAKITALLPEKPEETEEEDEIGDNSFGDYQYRNSFQRRSQLMYANKSPQRAEVNHFSDENGEEREESIVDEIVEFFRLYGTEFVLEKTGLRQKKLYEALFNHLDERGGREIFDTFYVQIGWTPAGEVIFIRSWNDTFISSTPNYEFIRHYLGDLLSNS